MKKALIYAIITAVLFTTLEPVSKLIAGEINPYAITFIRFFIGGIILLPFSIAKLRKNSIKLTAKDFGMMALLGVLCICVSMLLLQISVSNADNPAVVALIFSSNSVFTILFASLMLNEKLTKQKIVALVLCSAGVLICADFKGGGTNILSIVYAILSALSFSLYTVLSKRAMKKVSGIIQTGFSFFFGSIVLLIILLFAGIKIVEPIDRSNILNLLYLGFIVSGVGYWTYFKALDKASALAASLVFFIKPILTPFAALLINNIAPAPRVYLAVVFVVAGSYFAAITKKKVPTLEQQEHKTC